jgi:hypothetical protein
MTDIVSPARARAESVFRRIEVTPEQKLDAMAEYRAAQEVVRIRMAAQRAARLAKESATLTDPGAQRRSKRRQNGRA